MPRIHITGIAAMIVAVAMGGYPAAVHAAPDEGSEGEDATKLRARQAYERGVAASEAGNYDDAARAFAEADEIRPNNVAIEAALDVCVLSDNAALGAELLERAKRDPSINPESVAKA